MRNIFFGVLACTVLATVNASAHDASADDDPWHPPLTQVVVQSPPPRFRYVGINFDVGVPDGTAFGVVVRPHLNWLRLNLSGTYNYLSPGIRGGFTLDPIKFPMAPAFTAEAGHYWDGKVPGVNNSPEIGYDYVNLHIGIEFGNRDAWRFYIRGGASWFDAHAGNFQGTIGSVADGVTVGDPILNGWVPSGKIGFAIYF